MATSTDERQPRLLSGAGARQLNPIAGREVNINAQFAALELSLDKDWLRYSASILYSSGDRDRNDGRGHGSVARGFDSIVDNKSFAGSEFSFFDTEGIKPDGKRRDADASGKPACQTCARIRKKARRTSSIRVFGFTTLV